MGRLVHSTREAYGATSLWDDFNDGDLAGWTVWSGSWDAYDFENLYHMTPGAIAYPQAKNDVEATFTYTIGNPQNPDQTAHVDLRYVNGGAQDGDSLRLTIKPNEVSLSQRVDGAWTTLGTASVQTQWAHYQVKVQAWGRHVRVWRNLPGQTPEKLLDVANVTQSGSTHFVVRAETGSTHEFDNVVVRGYLEATGAYAYDALGRRIARTSDAERFDDVRYVYDGWQVAEERDAAGAVRAEYAYGNGLDEVLRMTRDGQPYYYHPNDQGTVHAVTDAAGSVAERYAYGAYGAPQVYDGTGQALASSAVGNPYLFTGREYDGETTFYHYRHRYLDPRQGRFVTRDPLGIWGDPGNWGNAYAYCGNDPWTFTDPLGLAGGRGFPVLDDGHIPSTAGGNTHRNIAQAASELPNFAGLQPGEALVAGATGIPLPYVENNLTSNVHDTAEAVGFFAGVSGFFKGGVAVCHKVVQGLPKLPEFLTGLWRATDDVADVTGAARAADEAARLALPAPQQITAMWGTNTYKGGVVMTAIEHINYRHAFNSGWPNVSRFAQGTTVEHLRGYVDYALRYGTVTPGTGGPNHWRVVYDFGQPIGWTQDGKAATGIKIYVQNGYIRTAFPIGF